MTSRNGTIDVVNGDTEGLPLVSSTIEKSVQAAVSKDKNKTPTFEQSVQKYMQLLKQKQKKFFRGAMVVMAIYLISTQPSNLDFGSSEMALNGDVQTSKSSSKGPQVAWLMAFPNSGTTYMEKLLHTVSDRALGTNYGHEHLDEKGEKAKISLSKPLFDGEEGLNGPFRLSEKSVPNSGYVLTKTHCSGHCFSDCPPNWYIYSAEKFLPECARGDRYIPSDNAPEEQIDVQYDHNIVGKAVHLYRNPFDNIVGRFHNERRSKVLEGNHAWTKQYPDSPEGFKAWCLDADKRFDPIQAFNSQSANTDKEFLDLASKSFCYAEIIKYGQWHNNAHAATDSLDIPTHILHIEDFGGDLDTTLQHVLDFVELPKKKDPIPYSFNNYDSYFTKDEKTRMAKFLKYMSSPATWNELGRYVNDLNLHDTQINHVIADVNQNIPVETAPLVEPPKPLRSSSGSSPVAVADVNVAKADNPNPGKSMFPKFIPPGPQDNPDNGPSRKIILSPDPPNKPQVAWLMSFPNSGTTFTEKLVQAVTQATVATNYGHEFVNENNEEERLRDSLPVFSGKLKLNGPFRLSSKPLPNGGFLLTKTHCGGYCFSDCPPNWYTYTHQMFLAECLKGARYSTENGGDGTEQIWVSYNQEIVKRAVHLFRDPFDNVISRFNHEYKTNKNQQNTEWLDHYPKNQQGFKKWCEDAGNRITPSDTFHSEMTTFDRKFLDVVDRVPCYAEFIKYAQWHNNAFAVAKTMGISSHVVHYEDYEDNFDQVLKGLLDFVELPKKGEAPKFSRSKYEGYFTPDEKERIKTFLEYLSTIRTWEVLSMRYFNDAKSPVPAPVEMAPDGRTLPQVAWLMSFPNSGTTYTEKLVQMVTQFTVGTNYGHEHVNALGQADRVDESTPIFEGALDGPFRLSDAPLPDGGYILTKTHCGGYCFSDCPPNWYMLTPDKYMKECVRGARYSKKEGGEGSDQTWVEYDPTIVKKAVHLIRDPFDNIIARFHHEYKINDRSGNEEFTSKFTNDIPGFKKWCEDISNTIKPTDTYHSERTNFAPEFLELVKGVPCYGEFIKYIQWHNNAFDVQKMLNIKGLIIKYEDYHFDLEGTVGRLLAFVEQPNKGYAPEYLWHPYEGYYTNEELPKIANFLRFLANDSTQYVLDTEYLKKRNL